MSKKDKYFEAMKRRDFKPTIHDVVTGTEAGQTAAQAALDASMEAQRAVSRAASLEAILRHWFIPAKSDDALTERDSEILAGVLAAIAAYYEGLIPEEDTRKHAIKGVDQGIQLGWNMAIDQMHRNFKGGR